MVEEPGMGSMPANEYEAAVRRYLDAAAEAVAAGDAQLGMHLYMTAFERSSQGEGGFVLNEDAINGLKHAWSLAVELHERSLAEYLYDRLEPYLTSSELEHCATQLQQLMLLKLREFGLPQDALEEVSSLVSGDFPGLENAKVVHVERIPGGVAGKGFIPDGGLNVVEKPAASASVEDEPEPSFEATPALAADPDQVVLPAGEGEAPLDGELVWPGMTPNPSAAPEADAADAEPLAADDAAQDAEPLAADDVVEAADAAASDEPAASASEADVDNLPDGPFVTKKEDGTPAFGLKPGLFADNPYSIDTMLDAVGSMMAEYERQTQEGRSEDEGEFSMENLNAALERAASKAAKQAPAGKSAPAGDSDELNFGNIHGYQRAIRTMHGMGVGVQDNPEYQQLVRMLNARHGLQRPPAMDSLLFRAPAREDATCFMEAVMGEVGLPFLCMTVEENAQGMQMLCITTRADNRPKMNAARNAFEGPAVLMIEDLDVWGAPVIDQAEDMNPLMAAQLSRSAREATALIRSSVENPDVIVLASACSFGEVDPFFCDLLAPFTMIDLDFPDEEERADMWAAIADEHPSLRGISQRQLVAYSNNLTREDIRIAAREAIEEAYKESLAARSYLPVTADSLFAKLSSFFPLESPEYKALEDAVVGDLHLDLDGSVDEFLGLA